MWALRRVEILEAVITVATTIVAMTLVDLSLSISSGGQCNFSKCYAHLPSLLIFWRELGAGQKDCFVFSGLASAATCHCIVGNGDSGFFVLGDEGLSQQSVTWLDRRDRKPSKLAERWFMRSVQIVSGNRFHKKVKCFVLRHRQKYDNMGHVERCCEAGGRGVPSTRLKHLKGHHQ